MAYPDHVAYGREEREEEDEHPRGSLTRFLAVCFFGALVVIVLGLYVIDNLFDDRKEFQAPAWKLNTAGVVDVADVRPAAARNQLLVYFTRDGSVLEPQTLSLAEGHAPHERGRIALEKLFEGPKQEGLKSPIPPGVKLRGFYLLHSENRQTIEAVIDCSREIKTPIGGIDSELLCVYAIVNTALANCETADAARILIDGAAGEALWGHVDIGAPLTGGAMMAREP